MKTAFVHSLCYLYRPNFTSKTHRSGDLFIDATIMQLATYEHWHHDRAVELWPESRSVWCGKVWCHKGLSAPKWRNKIVVNVNRQLFSSYAQCLSFLNSTSLPQSAIFAIIFPPESLCGITIRRWRTPTDYENVNDLLLTPNTIPRTWNEIKSAKYRCIWKRHMFYYIIQ